ncbi:phospholipase/carboxylesterase [Nitritalea halalkaliphila LW7]|uniref:Phospholipase/carboxylesterase n=1 Tax=Nitritalea halalkaliphila LW7 TaxID=1189621 RepID=I5CA13_9BACT|nr:dienelactone hydrolase family protein [Nitritalea halalkaliphila]EIM78665.1 phospholipase/carboxylesterase [Nitritalea halalkaliphila LW7]
MSNVKVAGKALGEAQRVAILLHGRGASATSILGLREALALEDFALLAPQAPGNTWYPYSFMAPDASNEPAYSAAIRMLQELVEAVIEQGYSSEQLYFIGFSQGACLALEFTARHARRYGGVAAFTGGLIGEQLRADKYEGDFSGTPVFIGASHQDFHVPLSRIEESVQLLTAMGAVVKTIIAPDTQHIIREKEVDWVNTHILNP